MTDEATNPAELADAREAHVTQPLVETAPEANPVAPAAAPLKKRCRMCRTAEAVKNVQTFVSKSNVKLNLCVDCFPKMNAPGVDLKIYAPPVNFKDIKAKSEAHRNKIDAALAVATCEFPGCKATSIKLYVTRTPNPKNGQLRGQYCTIHVNILNSIHKFLPFAYGRATDYIVESLICHREIDLGTVASKFEIPPTSILTLTRTLMELTNPHFGVLEGYLIKYPPPRRVG